MKAKVACALLTLLMAWVFPPRVAAIDLHFEKAIHDPSTIQKDNGRHWTFGTGDGIVSRYSDDLPSRKKIGTRRWPYPIQGMF